MMIFTSIILFNCSSEEKSLEVNSVDDFYTKRAKMKNASFEDQVEYKKEHLIILAQYIAENQSEIFNNLKNLRKNEGDDIFVEDAIKSSLQRTRNIDANKTLKISQALEAFIGVDDINLKPTIEVYKRDYENGLILRDNEKTLYVISSDEEELEAVKGYELNEDGELEEKYEEIFEETASARMTVILDLTPADGGNAVIDPGYGGGGSGGSGGGTFAHPRLRLDNMTVRQHKEHWTKGKSEVHIVNFTENTTSNSTSGWFGNNTNGWYFTPLHDPSGRMIRHWRRSWVPNNQQHIGSTLHTNNNNNQNVYFYVIFEYDWPTSTKTESVLIGSNGQFRNLSYKSNNSIYAKNAVSLQQSTNNRPFANGFVEDTWHIRYNLIYN